MTAVVPRPQHTYGHYSHDWHCPCGCSYRLINPHDAWGKVYTTDCGSRWQARRSLGYPVLRKFPWMYKP